MTAFRTNFIIDAGKDYYVAAAFDLPGGQTTSYLQNLTDGGSLQTTSTSHSLGTLNSDTFLFIGGGGGLIQPPGILASDGLNDEVRLSTGVLQQSELLISNVPEPSTALLLGFGLVGLAWRRRKL